MALRLVFGWIALNVGALLMLALVDVLRVAAKGMVRVLRGTRRLEKAPG